MHVDPEFETFTYGDPTPPKRSLLRLSEGDLLVFYAGLEGWGVTHAPALYIVGFFEVEKVVLAATFEDDSLASVFGANFHVRHPSVLEDQRQRLVLIKGSEQSRLLNQAALLSEQGTDVRGKPLKVLSQAMRQVFGDFGGRVSIQRSPPRWVAPAFVERAAEFVRALS